MRGTVAKKIRKAARQAREEYTQAREKYESEGMVNQHPTPPVKYRRLKTNYKRFKGQL